MFGVAGFRRVYFMFLFMFFFPSSPVFVVCRVRARSDFCEIDSIEIRESKTHTQQILEFFIQVEERERTRARAQLSFETVNTLAALLYSNGD